MESDSSNDERQIIHNIEGSILSQLSVLFSEQILSHAL